MTVQLLEEAGGSLRLGLYGEVGYEITTAGVTAALREAAGRPITISVDSYGGDALQGIAIHNLLARYPGKKRAVVEGVAASAASLFPLAADERVMPSNAFLMIHNAWGGGIGDASDLRDQADLLERISAAYRKTYSEGTGLLDEEVRQLMDAETWLDGEGAMAAGFATEISAPRDIKASSLKIPLDRFQQIPEALLKPEAAICLEGHEDEPAVDTLMEILADELADDPSPDSDSVSTLPATPKVEEPTMSETAAIEAASIAARDDERARVKTIRAMCERAEVGASVADELIDGGSSVDRAREVVLERVTARKPQPERAIATEGEAMIGMSKREAADFSFRRAFLALSNPNDRSLQDAAAFEFEVSRAAQQRSGRPTAGIQVPYDVLRSPARADLVVGTPASGGDLVETELRSGDFIDLLRNRLAMAQLGVTMLTGLQGDISVPRQTSASTAYWVGESASPTESQPGIDQVNMSPKTLGAFVDYSRKLLLQSSISVETMVRNDLTRVLGLEIDRAALYGTGGSNQPLGLTGTSGLAVVPTTGYGTFSEIVSLETEVAVGNADVGALGYLMNAASRGALKTTEKSATSTAQFVYENDQVNGYSVAVSNQVANKDIFFGNWGDFVMAMWGGLDLMVDPYAGSTSGTVRVVALQSIDYAVKHPESFAYGQEP